MVSIVCTNYNKGDWIAEAIEGFMSQKTSFKYEILLIDDKSTDHSVDIIREYANKYPRKIRAFYNKENLDITKTWIKVCSKAKGKYIARCDGDDYWIDNEKLQKQVNLLEESNDSKWCCTDYDVVNQYGDNIHRSAVETGYIVRPSSYAEMLVTKGFTMSSTWLVETQLMNKVNSELSTMAVDDTFNIQLDLFNMTRLTYLPDPTCVYRVSEGSDSKPLDHNVSRLRSERLLNTQIEYIHKYKNVDYPDIIEKLFKDQVAKDDIIGHQQATIDSLHGVVKERIKEIQEKDEVISNILSSRSYKIGAALSYPIRMVNSARNKK